MMRRFYMDRGAGMEMRADVPDLIERARVLRNRGAKNIRLARKFGWTNQPRVLTFNLPTRYGLTPEDDALKQWTWDNGLTIHLHWREDI